MRKEVLEKWLDINESNKKAIEDYNEYRETTKDKSFNTIKCESITLRKLAKYLKTIDFKDATREQMIGFFGDSKIVKVKSKDLYGTQIIQFYQWLLDLKRKERPSNMEWFEYRTSAAKAKDKDANAKEKYFITKEDYNKLLKFSPDLQEKALWETMYLSGARPSEICSMKIDSKIELEDGYAIRVYDSKTIPRDINLSEYPEHLLRWIENHPFQNNKKKPLWLSVCRSKMFNPMNNETIYNKLMRAIKRCRIKDTIRPHSFRKTRASLMFQEYTDKEMALHFGWKLRSVPLRKEEYDLTSEKDLRRKVFGNGIKKESLDTVKAEKEQLKDRYEQRIKKLEEQMKKQHEEHLKQFDRLAMDLGKKIKELTLTRETQI